MALIGLKPRVAELETSHGIPVDIKHRYGVPTVPLRISERSRLAEPGRSTRLTLCSFLPSFIFLSLFASGWEADRESTTEVVRLLVSSRASLSTRRCRGVRFDKPESLRLGRPRFAKGGKGETSASDLAVCISICHADRHARLPRRLRLKYRQSTVHSFCQSLFRDAGET